MVLRRFKIVLVTLFAISACLLVAAPSAMADEVAWANKLQGAWVAKAIEAPIQWSYVLSMDSSGRRAAGHGSVDVGVREGDIFGPVFEPGDSASPILISLVMTGPNTARYYSIWYGLKALDPPNLLTAEIVYIGVVTGEITFVGPGKAEGTHQFKFFHPTQDVDGDGFPDAGETTPYSFTLHTVDTRLPMPE